MNTIPTHVALRNQWRTPRDLALHIASRDLACIYCGNQFSPIGPIGRRRASWKHIINDLALITEENIAVCCMGCNASKGTKDLHVWLQSVYCAANYINDATLAPVARSALLSQLEYAATTLSPSPGTTVSSAGPHPVLCTVPSENATL